MSSPCIVSFALLAVVAMDFGCGLLLLLAGVCVAAFYSPVLLGRAGRQRDAHFGPAVVHHFGVFDPLRQPSHARLPPFGRLEAALVAVGAEVRCSSRDREREQLDRGLQRRAGLAVAAARGCSHQGAVPPHVVREWDAVAGGGRGREALRREQHHRPGGRGTGHRDRENHGHVPHGAVPGLAQW